MKFTILCIIAFLALPLTAFSSISGDWNVDGGRCFSKKSIEVSCKSLPIKINVVALHSQIKLTLHTNKGKEVKTLRNYGEQNTDGNYSYSIFWYSNNSIHYEAIEILDWNFKESWIIAEVLHDNTNLLEFTFGEYNELSHQYDVTKLYLSKL